MNNIDRMEAVSSTSAARRLTERQPLVDDVYEVLVDMVMRHTFEPGERISIDGLARTLGVSPTPIREAMARLEAEGLIVKEPRRSYTLAPLISQDELRALIDFRLLVEPAAAAAAARNASAETAAALVEFARNDDAGSQYDTTNRLDTVHDATFHDRIAELSGNPWLRESLLRLRSHLHMYQLYHRAQPVPAAWPEHVAIAEAIAARDPEAAAEAMRVHLTTAMKRMDAVLAACVQPTGAAGSATGLLG